MLNPQKPLHIYLGRFLFHLPHNQRRWHHYMGLYLPILNPAFERNEAARLLVIKALKRMNHRNFKGAIRAIQALLPTARNGSVADKALCGVLSGLVDLKAGNYDRAASRFRGANTFNHRYFMPYLLAADNDVNSKIFYSRAAVNYQTAIDCIYEYPPLNDITKHFLCSAYAGLCFCHIMMHQYNEAKADLLHAEQMGNENAAILCAKAYLHAALRQKAEALSSVEKLSKYEIEGYAEQKEKINRILAEQDTHFTRLPIGSPEEIAAFWQNFLAREDELKRLLDKADRAKANKILGDLLREIDHYSDNDYGIDILIKDNAYTLYFRCANSLTYTPFVQDILAACPDAVRRRWHIICDP